MRGGTRRMVMTRYRIILLLGTVLVVTVSVVTGCVVLRGGDEVPRSASGPSRTASPGASATPSGSPTPTISPRPGSSEPPPEYPGTADTGVEKGIKLRDVSK